MSSVAFGDALAHELPALLGRANAIAPNRVQNGSTRDGDEGGGSARRRLAVAAVRRLAALWSRGPLGRRIALVWCLYFVRAGSEARGQCEAGKPGAYARRVHLLTLDRGERVELLNLTRERVRQIEAQGLRALSSLSDLVRWQDAESGE